MPDTSTRSVIEQSIAATREDGPADGGPDTTGTETAETPETADTADEPETPDPDTPDVPEGEEAVTPPAEPEKKPEEKAPENEDVEAEPEFTTDKNGRKRVNSIPQPRVKKMVEGAVKKAVEAATKDHTTKIAGHEETIKSYERMGSLIETDPDRFMTILAETNPAYKAYVKGGASAAAEQPAARVNTPMPEPDGVLPDGVTPAYTVEGHKKLQEWNVQQAEDRAYSRLKKEYGWIDDAKKANDDRQAEIPKVREQIAEARKNWEEFEEHKDAIHAELQKDSAEAERTGRPYQMDLHTAYRRVMATARKAEREKHAKEVETLKTDRNKMRDDIIKELKGRPSATAAASTTPTTKTEESGDDNRSTASIIRDSIAGLRR